MTPFDPIDPMVASSAENPGLIYRPAWPVANQSRGTRRASGSWTGGIHRPTSPASWGRPRPWVLAAGNGS